MKVRSNGRGNIFGTGSFYTGYGLVMKHQWEKILCGFDGAFLTKCKSLHTLHNKNLTEVLL